MIYLSKISNFFKIGEWLNMLSSVFNYQNLHYVDSNQWFQNRGSDLVQQVGSFFSLLTPISKMIEKLCRHI